MRGVYPVSAIRVAEHELMRRLPDGALMQRAASGLATHCARMLGRCYGARVVLLVGSGSNGGDAMHAGARLAHRGAQVSAVLLDPERAHPGGVQALRRAGGRFASRLDVPVGADLVVDGILGIGGKGDLGGAAASVAEAAATARDDGAIVVAADLPSGVDADTGRTGSHAVRADVTVTFGALKPGLVSGDGANAAGEVRLVDIGLGPWLPEPRIRVLERDDVAAALCEPGPADDKYTRGVVGVVAGSAQYPGAGVLATGSARYGGAGMVRYLGHAQDAVRARYPEIVAHPNAKPSDVQVQSWVVGPGMGTDDSALALLADVLHTDLPVVLDADAITLMAHEPDLVRRRAAPTVLTPHDREFARFAGEPGPDRIASACRAAADLGATVLLKGNATIVADRDGRVHVNPTGTPWLATAGSGDVLSGLIGSLLATGQAALLAAAVGAYVHGVAAQLAAADGPPTAADVLGAVRPAVLAVRQPVDA
jgi:ADP-dependent NAD(P)H-hydrate dehydratase / NAD(P)H-hydrate epimerase